jgi:beta-glucosidase
MGFRRHTTLILLLLLLLHTYLPLASAVPAPSHPDSCLGEFSYCNETGACTLFGDGVGDCGNSCKSGEYLCPVSATCVTGAAGYLGCPGLAGTHLDHTLDVERRLDYLVAHASLEEQAAQLTGQAPALARLGIPSYSWLNDDLHGVASGLGTIFPNGCGLGASWDKALLRSVGRAIGEEARGGHNGLVHSGNRGTGGGLYDNNGVGLTMYSPNVNLARDPRWGRSQEVYSEDPRLVGALAKEYVEGAQSDGLAAAGCKHFAGYDVENVPVDRTVFDANVTSRDMFETYLPAFEACVRQAGAASVMCSFNLLNGKPTCADPDLLDGVLRRRWNWPGFVVGDYDSWENLVNPQHYSDTLEDAAAVGIAAGLDQEGGGSEVSSQLPAAVAAGKVNASAVARAFRRLFSVRLQLGMYVL